MKKLILVLIIASAFFLRFYRLADYPALNADEAAIGYNAYSLIQTGKDEHGNPWPVHFQSFNDFKPGLYFYLVLPFVKIFGLNEWAVRIPGALLGVATVLAVYLLALELGGLGRLGKYSQVFALTSAFFLAISPWHIHFSRGGWEVNVAMFFITGGVWLFLRSSRQLFSLPAGKAGIKYLVLSILFFGLSLYTYHAARIVVPLLIFGLLLLHRKTIKENLKEFVLVCLIGLILLVPLSLDLSKGAVFSRAAGVGLFADPGPIARINEQRGEHQDFRSLPAIFLHNKLVNYALAFLENLSEHFWGEFLFLSGDDIQRNKVPETGQMYLLDVVFLIVGLIGAIRSTSTARKGWLVILWWLAVAPAASALTFQSPHALRAHNMVIPLNLISSFGLVSLANWLKEVIKPKILLFTIYYLLFTIIAWNFTRYLHLYWVHMAREYPFSSQYGVKELVEYVRLNGNKYEKVIVTDRYDQPYILFLFYQKYPPEKFQREHKLTPRDKFGFSTVRNFDKYKFEEIEFDSTKVDYPNSLIVGTDEEIPDEANVVKEVYGINGYKYFQVVAN